MNDYRDICFSSHPGQPKLYYPANLLDNLPPFSLSTLLAERGL